MSRIKRDYSDKLVKDKIKPDLNSIVKTRTRKYIFKEIPGISIFNKCSHCEFNHKIMCYKYRCLYDNENRRVSGVFKLVQ